LELQHILMRYRFFLNTFLFVFLLTGCTTAPRYARQTPQTTQQKNRTPEKNLDTQRIKKPNDQTATPSQSQIQIPENGPTQNEIPLKQVEENEPVFTQNGLATYYADSFHGKRTAYGEKYDKFEFTAAHRTLPLNTKVKVTSINNNKSVIVRINDRGPHGANRIIDLSRAAAKEIDLIRNGVAKVKIEVFGDSSVSR
jgi:rare lipoprotein A